MVPMPNDLSLWLTKTADAARMDAEALLKSAEVVWSVAQEGLPQGRPAEDGSPTDVIACVEHARRLWTVPVSAQLGDPPSRPWMGSSSWNLEPADDLPVEQRAETLFARAVRSARLRLSLARGEGVFQDDLAAILACSRSTVRLRVEDGTLATTPYSGPKRKGSEPLLLSAASVEAWLGNLGVPGISRSDPSSIED